LRAARLGSVPNKGIPREVISLIQASLLGGGLDGEALLAERCGVVRLEPLLPRGARGRIGWMTAGCDQRHLAYVALRCAVARLPGRVRAVHHGLQSLQSLEPPGHLVGDVRRGDRQHRCHRHCRDRQFPHQGASFGRRRKRGPSSRRSVALAAAGTTTLHALSDDAGRPRVLLLAPGNQHDVTMAPELLRLAGPIRRLLADKAYDTNKLRACWPNTASRRWIPSIARRKP